MDKQEYEDRNFEELKKKRAKTRWTLFPWKQLKVCGELFTMGASKHGDFSWQQLDEAAYKDALSRHFVAFMSGERDDPEDGKSHLSHIACNALILQWHEDQKDGQDR